MPIVVLACSAGGLAALTAVLEPLPADLPAAVTVLQHMEPNRVSELPDILGQRTALPVGFAADGDMLTPGRVPVAPAGCHTQITADLSIATGHHQPRRHHRDTSSHCPPSPS